MKALLAFIASLVFALCQSANAKDLTTEEYCVAALAAKKADKLLVANYGILEAVSSAREEHRSLPKWCRAHYREIRLGTLELMLKIFNKSYDQEDWQLALRIIPAIDITAKEFKISIAPIHFAKRIVANAKYEQKVTRRGFRCYAPIMPTPGVEINMEVPCEQDDYLDRA